MSQQIAPVRDRLLSERGMMIPGEGIYFGIGRLWTDPEYKQKHMEGPISYFDMYAGPENLTDENGKPFKGSLADTFRLLASTKNWHGHDGFRTPSPVYAPPYEFVYRDSSVRSFIIGEKYYGEWLIPPLEVVDGLLPDPFMGLPQRTQDYTLCATKALNLKETWTCSQTSTARMIGGTWDFALYNRKRARMSGDEMLQTRPVRFVPRSSGPDVSPPKLKSLEAT